MKLEIGAGSTYGSKVQLIRPFFWEKQIEEMGQEKKPRPNCNSVLRVT